MADISTYLAAIMSAVYGEDVRGSIHDAIEIINEASEVVLSTGTAVSSASSSSTGFFTDSLYLNTNTYELWKCIGTDSWQSQGALKGDDGNGIASIAKTATAGLVDTYTITYDDGDSTTFNVTNGADGQNGSIWYKGTALTGTGTGITGFPGVLNDFYLNSSTGMVYNCTLTGSATTATWDYVMTMSGGGGGSVTVVDNLTTQSATDALSANQGYVLKGYVDGKASDTPTFSQAGSRTNIASGESTSTLFGKIMKWFADLKDLAFIAKGSGNTKFLREDGTWQSVPSGGHTMIDNTTLINSMNAAITEGTTNDDVVSAYGVGKWANVTEITYLVHGTSSSSPIHNTGVGTWDDTFANESDWLVIADLVGILSDPTKHVEVVFDPDYFADDIPVFGGWLIDDTTGKICIKFANEISNADCLTGVVGVKITTDRTAVSWINGAPT